MFEKFDFDLVLFGVMIAFVAYIFIDMNISIKKQKKERKAKNDQRIKEGKEPIDYDNISVGGGGMSESEAAEGFRNFIHRNMGNMG